MKRYYFFIICILSFINSLASIPILWYIYHLVVRKFEGNTIPFLKILIYGCFCGVFIGINLFLVIVYINPKIVFIKNCKKFIAINFSFSKICRLGAITIFVIGLILCIFAIYPNSSE